MPYPERRKFPRLPETVPCRLISPFGELTSRTENLSCGGILCRLSRPLDLMTKLEVSLELPSEAGHPESIRRIRCVGVVVRREADSTGEPSLPHRTAIFFSEISQEDRRRLGEFILRGMLRRDSLSS